MALANLLNHKNFKHINIYTTQLSVGNFRRRWMLMQVTSPVSWVSPPCILNCTFQSFIMLVHFGGINAIIQHLISKYGHFGLSFDSGHSLSPPSRRLLWVVSPRTTAGEAAPANQYKTSGRK